MPALASREGIKTRTMHIPVAARAALAAAAARGVAAAHDVRCPARVRCAVLSALRHSSPHPEQRVMSQQRAQRAPGPARRRRGRPRPTSSWPVAASTREARARLDEARRRTQLAPSWEFGVITLVSELHRPRCSANGHNAGETHAAFFSRTPLPPPPSGPTFASPLLFCIFRSLDSHSLTASTRSLYVHLPVIIWSSRGRESRVSCQDRAQNEVVRFFNTHSSSAYPFGS